MNKFYDIFGNKFICTISVLISLFSIGISIPHFIKSKNIPRWEIDSLVEGRKANIVRLYDTQSGSSRYFFCAKTGGLMEIYP